MPLRTYTPYLFFAYLAAVITISLFPLGGMSTAMNEVDVLSIRLDYLLHATVFLPLVPLWQLTRPSDPLWLMVLTGLLLASVAEGSHYLLPNRALNINGLLGNVAGVLLGAMIGWLISLRRNS